MDGDETIAAPNSLAPGSPFLVQIGIKERHRKHGVFPFTLPMFAPGFELGFTTPVTFLVGENGSGKSTILEAIAWAIGFGPKGGNRDHGFRDIDSGDLLGAALALTWRQRSADGFFLRAETFFDFTEYLESMESTFMAYGGESFHNKSHGEAFLALFENRFEDGIYLLDEPEAALSPQRQLAFLRILHRLTVSRRAQFIIATHSPMLLAFPGARVLQLDEGHISEVDYRDTDHYRVMVEFLNAPERYFRYLFAPDNDAE